ncbi:MAG: hypothetical protein HQL03_10400 [Nitrospirae bacterium]|nr:hypothetical protein [Nitrospirota bacterium]
MIVVKLKDVLDYYDGPILLTVLDSADKKYICQLINRDAIFDEFFCVPISQYRLESFYFDQLDLRDICINPEKSNFYLLKVINYKEAMNFESIAEEDILSEWYPDEGIKLTTYPAALDAIISTCP